MSRRDDFFTNVHDQESQNTELPNLDDFLDDVELTEEQMAIAEQPMPPMPIRYSARRLNFDQPPPANPIIPEQPRQISPPSAALFDLEEMSDHTQAAMDAFTNSLDDAPAVDSTWSDARTVIAEDGDMLEVEIRDALNGAFEEAVQQAPPAMQFSADDDKENMGEYYQAELPPARPVEAVLSPSAEQQYQQRMQDLQNMR